MGLLESVLASLMGSSAGTGFAPSSQNPLAAILNGLGGGNQAQSSNLLAAAMGMLQQHGGLSAVLDTFRQNGMAQHADSWVGTGANLPISGAQVRQVFGESSMSGVASQLGQSPGQASSVMAQLLPELVNHLTPQGQVPADHQDLISKALVMLRGQMA
jgi:uncharacterized protein YidB (DUF937 family)